MTQLSLLAQKACSVEGCGQARKSRSWCNKHYQRWLKTGDPDTPLLSFEKRFWSKVEVGHPSGCWVWKGAKDRGYGRVGRQGVTGYAHRVAFEMLVGPIPAGMQLDHLCRNRPCVNPDHLEIVTNRTNQLRAFGPSAKNARKVECQQGHQLLGDNLYVHPATGHRQCQTCRKRHREASRRKGGES